MKGDEEETAKQFVGSVVEATSRGPLPSGRVYRERERLRKV